MAPLEPKDPWDGWDVIFVLLTAAVGLATRLPGLSIRELWVDEANSMLMAIRPVPDVIDALTRDGNPPLYYLLLHAWQLLWGASEVALRSLSVLWGILLLPLLYYAGRRWFGRTAGVVATLFAALSPFHIYYSRETRMYTMLAFLSLLALVALDRLARQGRPRDVLLASLALLACVYTHNYGLFFLPVGGVACLLYGRGGLKAFTRAAAAAALALLGALPWLPVVLRQASTDVGAWIPGLFRQEAGSGSLSRLLDGPGTFLAALLRSLEVMSPGTSYPFYLRGLPRDSSLSTLSLGLTLALLGAALCHALGPASSPRRRRVALLFCALFIPQMIPILYSVLHQPVYLIGRYEILTFPFAALLVGLGASWIMELKETKAWRAGSAAVLASLLLGLCGVTLHAYYTHPAPAGYARPIARHLAQKSKAGDALLFCGITQGPVEYALRRQGIWARFSHNSFPGEQRQHLGWYPDAQYRARLATLDQEAVDLVGRLRQGLRPGQQLWLIHDNRFPELHRTLLRQLGRGFGPVRRDRSLLSRGVRCYDLNPE